MSFNDPVKTFCNKWGLDHRSEAAIRELSIEDQMRAFVGFDPNLSTRNMDSKFMAWIRTFGSAPALQGSGGMQSGVKDGLHSRLLDFAAKWNLDAQSQQFLEAFPTAVTLSVINDFAPPPMTQNVSAKLHAFARLRATEMGHRELGSLPRGGHPRQNASHAGSNGDNGDYGFNHHGAGAGGAAFSAYSPGTDASRRQVSASGNTLRQQFNDSEEAWGISASPGCHMEDVAGFCAKWGLDDTCLTSLQTLTESLRQEVMLQFAPKEGTRNPSALLLAFIRQRRSGHAEGTSDCVALAPQQPQAHGVSDGEISAFVQRWGLDDACGALVQTLPSALQYEVMSSFAPKEGTRNPSALLHAFVRNRRQGHDPGLVAPQPLNKGYQSSPGIASTAADFESIWQFAEYWSLDEDAQRMLERLNGDVLRNVLSHFDPPPGTGNVSAKLHAFIRGVQEKLGQRAPRSVDWAPSQPSRDASARLANAPWNISSGGFVPAPRVSTPSGYSAHATSVHVASVTSPMAVGCEIEQFIAKWGLDMQCEHVLRQLGPEHLAAVIREFAPQPGTVNINGKLHGFVRSITASHANSMPASSPEPGDRVGAFLAQWGLDAAAEAAMRATSPEIQEAVMAEFSPAPGTLNASNKLCAFIRAKQSRVLDHGGGPDFSASLPQLALEGPDSKRPRLRHTHS